MMREPAGQGGGRLGGQLDHPTLAPGHLELHGHLAVGTPDDFLDFQGEHLAGTQADITQQPQHGPVADADRSRQIGLTQQPLVLGGRDALRRGCLLPGGVQAGGQLGAAGVAGKLAQGAVFQPQRGR
jgi:hypothetical protein